MLLDIGVIVGFYALARLSTAKIARIVSGVAAVVILVALTDLASQAIGGRSLWSRFQRAESAPPAATAPSAPGTSATNTSRVTRAPGGSIRTPLGYGIVLAKESTLTREWIVVHDPGVPVTFAGTPGVTTTWKRAEYSGGDYQYQAQFTVQANEDVQAVQVRFLAFNVWGEHMQTLSYEEVADVAKGAKKEITGVWRVFSENDAEKYYASIGYVSRVRLKTGKVIAAADEPVVEEARRFSTKFSVSDLEPPKATPQPAK